MYITGLTITPNGDRSACLKITRPQDEAELSISFDNNCSQQQDCKRVEVCIFNSQTSNEPTATFHWLNDREILFVITTFLNGLSAQEISIPTRAA
jgi:hypothetical protein